MTFEAYARCSGIRRIMICLNVRKAEALMTILTSCTMADRNDIEWK